jgi:hypothetical protein
MIIFESLLTTFEASIIFVAAGAVKKSTKKNYKMQPRGFRYDIQYGSGITFLLLILKNNLIPKLSQRDQVQCGSEI